MIQEAPHQGRVPKSEEKEDIQKVSQKAHHRKEDREVQDERGIQEAAQEVFRQEKVWKKKEGENNQKVNQEARRDQDIQGAAQEALPQEKVQNQWKKPYIQKAFRKALHEGRCQKVQEE